MNEKRTDHLTEDQTLLSDESEGTSAALASSSSCSVSTQVQPLCLLPVFTSQVQGYEEILCHSFGVNEKSTL